MYIKTVLDNGRKKVNQLHKVISNRNINLSAHRLFLLSAIRPSIEYGSKVWEGNKRQAGSFESTIFGGAKHIHGCSFKTRNVAVRGDMDLDTLQSHSGRAKLKWWYSAICANDHLRPTATCLERPLLKIPNKSRTIYGGPLFNDHLY